MNALSFSQAALTRFRTIRPFLEDDVPLARIAGEDGVSERTLRRWVRRYRDSGLAGLEHQPRADRGKRRKIAPELEKLVKASLLQRPRPLITAIHRKVLLAAADMALPPPSYAVVCEIARELDPALLILAEGNAAAYRDKYELIHRRESAAPNEMWQADHTLLDIVLLDGPKERRPWLTVIIDDYSRALCGYFLSFDAPCAVHTALALRQAIWRKDHPQWPVCGIPETLYVDNGSDFVSEHVEQACINLKIKLIHSRPGRPRGRGRVERMFRTINQNLLADLPGHTVKGKPASRPALDIASFTAHFDAFLHEVYHRRPHGGTGQPPIKRWQTDSFLPALPESSEQLDTLLMRVRKARKVQRDGIRFQSLRYIDPTLAAFVGEDVEILYDPRDAAEIRVYHHGRFVCRAVCQDIAARSLGVDEVRRARRKLRGELRQKIRNGKAVLASNPDTEPEPISRGRRSRLKLYADD